MALRPSLKRIWAGANAGLRRDPGDPKYNTGWVAEIPTFQVLNFLQFKNDTTMLALAERGVLEWGQDIEYTYGGLAWDETNGKIYICQVNNPNKFLPSTNPGQWKESSAQIPRSEFDSAKAAWTNHIQNITGNPHGLTPGKLNAYTKQEVDLILTQYRALVEAHASNKNNPHQTKAIDIGAVPVDGGTYTGDVIFDTRQVLLQADGGHKLGVIDGIGLFFQSGAAVLGIETNTGKATTGSSVANRSEIITAATFEENKKLYEPKYAAPVPDLNMPLLNGLDITNGNVYAESNYDTVSNAVNMWLQMKPALTAQNILFNENPMLNAMDLTIALDFQFADVQATEVGVSGNRQVIGFGDALGSRTAIAFTGGTNRSMIAYSGVANSAGAPFRVPDKNMHRVVLVRNATRVSLYVDGVRVYTTATTTIPVVGNTYGITMPATAASANAEPPLLISNFRAWRLELTEEQICAL